MSQHASGSDGTAPGARPRSRARFLNRQAEIVDIAARLFAEQGYDATSLDDLSEATGLQRGGLYHYIGSKQALLFQIHERFIEPLLEEAREIEKDASDPEERIRALARALMRDIADYRDQVTVFLQEWRSIKRLDEPRAKEIVKARREFEAIVQRALADGVAAGEFAVGDLRLAVLAFLGMFNYSYQWYRKGGSYTADDVADHFSTIFLEGIRTRPASG